MVSLQVPKFLRYYSPPLVEVARGGYLLCSEAQNSKKDDFNNYFRAQILRKLLAGE